MAITKQPLDPDERLSITEAAGEVDRIPEYLRRLIRAGQLPAERDPEGFRWLLRRGDVVAFFERRAAMPQAVGAVAARHRRKAMGL